MRQEQQSEQEELSGPTNPVSPGILPSPRPAPRRTRSGWPAPHRRRARSAGGTDQRGLRQEISGGPQGPAHVHWDHSQQIQASGAWLRVTQSTHVRPEKPENTGHKVSHQQGAAHRSYVGGETWERSRTVSVCQNVSTMGQRFSPTTV